MHQINRSTIDVPEFYDQRSHLPPGSRWCMACNRGSLLGPGISEKGRGSEASSAGCAGAGAAAEKHTRGAGEARAARAGRSR